jgi:hypothetical protein
VESCPHQFSKQTQLGEGVKLGMKIGTRKLRMSNGKVRTFKSKKARDNFERVAQAVKHGWKPRKKK